MLDAPMGCIFKYGMQQDLDFMQKKNNREIISYILAHAFIGGNHQ